MYGWFSLLIFLAFAVPLAAVLWMMACRCKHERGADREIDELRKRRNR